MDPRDEIRKRLDESRLQLMPGRKYEVLTPEGPSISVLARSASNAILYAEAEHCVYAVDVIEVSA